MNGAERSSGSESAKGEVERIELDRAGQTIARRMAESKATAPHLYLRAEVDMSQAAAVRLAFSQTVADGEPLPTLNDMVVKAVALALRDHPRANGTYRDGGFELYSRINVGIAVAAADTFAVPTITDADRLTLGEIASESSRLAARVRDGQITPPELAGGTFTVSNLGMFGVRSIDPVINGGQAAILGVGEVSERAVVKDGAVAVAQMMEISLACDHRILYGAGAAAFLAGIKANLEQPDLLA
ncbi:MAG: 2-oxo acid dehydrogenase subunit E2 [Solirubrobacterales bacterium]